MVNPLLKIDGLTREYFSGETSLTVLNNIELSIYPGEMVAIIGPSGSGKSTLMNILGCLDKPTQGSYFVDGHDTSLLDDDTLAKLRREYFGFIFQRYNLLADLTALENTEMPAVYAGISPAEREKSAKALLTRLGLQERMSHKPSQLSGGQQQRVSIARALINGGKVILADEPTGALDHHSGQEVLAVLSELHKDGHTIILVTHDMNVAKHAQRIIQISDGVIVDDSMSQPTSSTTLLKTTTKTKLKQWQANFSRLKEVVHMSIRALISHRMRSFLTMLGIIIGIASVVSVIALGNGSKEKILNQISSLSTSTVEVRPGSGFGDEEADTIHTLIAADAQALANEFYVNSVTPVVSTSDTLRYKNVALNGLINGVGEQYFQVKGMDLLAGTSFNKNSIDQQTLEVVIDENTNQQLFGSTTPAIGKIIFLGNTPFRVIGVAKKNENSFSNNENLNVWIPYTTALYKILGISYLKSIIVRINDDIPINAAEQWIEKLLLQRHQYKDFFLINNTTIRETIESTSTTMRLLTGMIAVISLIVGGVGVMNIMLVSVTERTKEIGIRIAVGARKNDILIQFLIESLLICLVAGLLGIFLAYLVGIIVGKFNYDFPMVYSLNSILLAFASSTIIGIAFGFLPARNAARLNPIDALSRD